MTQDARLRPGVDKDTLADLVEAIARTGDAAAFASLFVHFAPRLKGYLMRLGADVDTAEELAQEAMLVLWRKAASFDRRHANVSTWLFTIARNKRIDVLRGERRAGVDLNDPMVVPSGEPPPDEAYGVVERDTQLRAAIRALPVEQAELLRLAFFEGLSHGSIAERRGLPLGTVKSRIRLAIGKLRKAVREPS